MRNAKVTLQILATSLFLTVSAAAEPPHAVQPSELQAAIERRVESQSAQRAEIQRLLSRPEVRELAAQYGLDIERAEASAANLDGEELQRLAAQAGAANAELEGGSALVITSTTIIIILLILILLLVV